MSSAVEKGQLPDSWEKKNLLSLCKVKTGKRDANHSTEGGKYRFYTCAYEYLRCDTFAFSGESIILPGNGANVGEVFYYDGDFDTGIVISPDSDNYLMNDDEKLEWYGIKREILDLDFFK